jgi:hypothetical protein
MGQRIKNIRAYTHDSTFYRSRRNLTGCILAAEEVECALEEDHTIGEPGKAEFKSIL